MTTAARLTNPAVPSAGQPEEQWPLEVSVLVPVTERPGPLPELYRDYSEVLKREGLSYEFIFAVEPWATDLLRPIQRLSAQGEPIRVLAVGQTAGETTLLRIAAAEAQGAVLITLPAYRRVVAAGLPALVRRVEAGSDLVVARRWPRCDGRLNRLQTSALHALLRKATGSPFHDIACGVRATRPGILEALQVRGEGTRFLPLIARRAGYRVEEISIPQHPDDARARVYGPGVYVRRLIDVLGLYFLIRFQEKPLRFFGLIGAATSVFGAVILTVVLVQRLAGQGLADRPLLLLGVLLVVLGVQSIGIGLVGEIIVHLHASRRKAYSLLKPPGPEPTTTAGDRSRQD